MKVEVAVLGQCPYTVPVPNSSYGLCGRKATSTKELRSCVKAEVAVLGSPSLIVIMVSVANCPYGLFGRKATLNLNLVGYMMILV